MGVSSEEHALGLARLCEWLCRRMYRPSQRAREISLHELQELIRDFFSDFTTRLELNVLSCEERGSFLRRHMVFGLCGIFDDSPQLSPPKSIFSIFARHCDGRAEMSASHLQQLLLHEFRVALSEREVTQLVAMTDLSASQRVSLPELAALGTRMQQEVATEVRSRLPTSFTPMALPGLNLPEEVVLTVAKLILKLLQTSDTFDDFFDSLPSFRPAAFQGMGPGGTQHYPDEMVVGLRRLGIDCEARNFEFGVGGAANGAQFAAAAVLTHTGFLQTVWAVWERYVVPAFRLGVNWAFRAGQAAALCVSTISAHFGLPCGARPPSAQGWAQVWALFDADSGGRITDAEFASVLLRLRDAAVQRQREGHAAVWPAWAAFDAAAWRRAALVHPPFLECDEVPRPTDAESQLPSRRKHFLSLVALLFAQADTSRGGSIDHTEFAAMYAAWVQEAERVEAEMQRLSVVCVQQQQQLAAVLSPFALAHAHGFNPFAMTA